MEAMSTVEIRTERLTLRPTGPEYLLSTHAYASDREHTRYMMFLPNETLEETRRFLEDCRREWEKPEPGYYEFAILADGIHVGAACLYPDGESGAAEVGWILRPECQGRGYATEAARAVMDFAVRRLGIRRFFAHCDAENRASQAVMRRLGMALADATGTRKNRAGDGLSREYRYELTMPSE